MLIDQWRMLFWRWDHRMLEDATMEHEIDCGAISWCIFSLYSFVCLTTCLTSHPVHFGLFFRVLLAQFSFFTFSSRVVCLNVVTLARIVYLRKLIYVLLHALWMSLVFSAGREMFNLFTFRDTMGINEGLEGAQWYSVCGFAFLTSLNWHFLPRTHEKRIEIWPHKDKNPPKLDRWNFNTEH